MRYKRPMAILGDRERASKRRSACWGVGAASASLALHLVLFIAAAPFPRRPSPAAAAPPFAVDLSDHLSDKRKPELATQQQPAPTGRPRSAARRGARARAAPPSLDALAPGLRARLSSGSAAASAEPSSAVARDALAFDDPGAYQMGFAREEDQDIGAFVEALHRRVDGKLLFDSLLAQYGHFGTVYAEFAVDRTGLLLQNSIRGGGHDRALKVYAIRSALVPALSQKLPESLWLKERDRVVLRAQFQFVFSESESSLFDENPASISGRALTFRRFTAQKPSARTLGQHLANGGLDVDAFRMRDAWKRYLKARENRRLDVDPFSVLRADPLY